MNKNMANKKNEGLSADSKIKVINNTTGSLSFKGVDDRKYLFQKGGSYKLVPLSVIEGLYNECSTFITNAYIFIDDKEVYNYLGVSDEEYKKIIPLKEVEEILNKDNSELQEILENATDVVKENVAIIAKKKGIDSKSKTKVIKDTTGFDINADENIED
jgi:hypothetical protein